jgi:3-(3-hydroxy-phenyl)propionate hydroxylase
MSGPTFASTGDLVDRPARFEEIGRGLWAFTAGGDPNSGVIVGDDAVMVVEAQATPRLAREVIARVRAVTDNPITHLALTHYHAVRVLGASAYGAPTVVMSEKARAMVVERGAEDRASEFARFPRLFRGHEEIPGLTWPTATFAGRMTVYLGRRPVDLMQPGRAHTAGDVVVYVPDANVMFTGDVVEHRSACYCGDGHFHDWQGALERIRARRPDAILPGRGAALVGRAAVEEAHDSRLSPCDLRAGRPRGAARRRSRRGVRRLPRGMRPALPRLRNLRALPALQRRPRLRRGARRRHAADLDRRTRRRAVGGALRRPPVSRGDAPPLYPYSRAPDQDAAAPVRHPVVVIGAGPVGLVLALDLAQRGTPVFVLDDNDRVSDGSRAVCYAKRPLEILDRLGCGDPVVAEGVGWRVGKVFRGDRLVYAFDLLPEAGHRRPAFVNLPQRFLEETLVRRLEALRAAGRPVTLRGRNRVTAVVPGPDGVTVTVDTPDGPYALRADWLIACDGAGSTVRGLLGLGFDGRAFEDSFLIADVIMAADLPAERRFWFDPPFNPGRSALLHKQPRGVWRIDLQLGRDVDRDAEKRPERVIPRLRAMLGPDAPFELDWVSVYTFQCRRMARFIEDAENLGRKLALVVAGEAPATLLDSYDAERGPAADRDIATSTGATDFIAPTSETGRLFRDAVLDLAERAPFARTLVNSGRLSTPARYDASPLNGPDALPGGPERTRPGAPCPDARLKAGHLLERLGGGFRLLVVDLAAPPTADVDGLPVEAVSASVADAPDLRERYLGTAATAVYLIRPDARVSARWPGHDPAAVAAAVRRAVGRA